MSSNDYSVTRKIITTTTTTTNGLTTSQNNYASNSSVPMYQSQRLESSNFATTASGVERLTDSSRNDSPKRSLTPSRRKIEDLSKKSTSRGYESNKSSLAAVATAYRPYFVPGTDSQSTQTTRAQSSYVAPIGYTLSAPLPEDEVAAQRAKTNLVKSLFKDSNKQDDHKQTLARLEITGDLFWDAEFPPEWSSLWGYGEVDTPIDMDHWKSLKWKRASEISTPVSVFDIVTSPKDIVQGYLGDCYFISSVSALAEHSHRLKKLFVTDSKNSFGCYCLRLSVNGTWRDIVVDDFFPFSLPDSKPAFTRCQGPEIWAPLLEKAWAKLHKGYLNITDGNAAECLNTLTNAPTSTVNLQEPTAWMRIVEGVLNKFIITAGSAGAAGRDILSEIGLVGSHNYTILDAYDVLVEGIGKSRLAQDNLERSSKHCCRLLKIRNAWGGNEWKGDWSDKCFLWTDQLKKEVGRIEADSSIFFIDFEDFKKYFSDVFICHYHDAYVNTHAQYESEPDHGNYFRVSIREPGTYYFSCHQPGEKMFPKKEGYQYSKINCVVAHMVDVVSFGYVGGVQKSERDLWIKCVDTVRGDYLFYVKPTWETANRQFFLSIYGPSMVTIEKIQKSSINDGLVLNAIYMDRARKTQRDYKTFASEGEPDIKYFQDQFNDGYGYFYFENNSVSTHLTAWLSIKVLSNIRLMPPHSGREAKISLKPGQKEIILYRVLSFPAYINYSVLPIFRREVNALKELAKKFGGKVAKLSKTGEDVGIYLYKYRSESEIVYLYVNNSRNYVLSERIEFVLDGCHLEGTSMNTADITLRPGDDRLFRILPKDETEGNMRIKVIVSNTSVSPA